MGEQKNYEKNPSFWKRDKKEIQSDFLCRPYVLDLMGEIKGEKVIDLGCGEGYLSRKISKKGGKVTGVDISSEMIDKAEKQEKRNNLGIKYYVGSILKLDKIKPSYYDVAISVMVFNSLEKNSEWDLALENINSVLKKKGNLIIAVQHPFEIIHKPKTEWIRITKNKNDSYWDEEGIYKKLFRSDGSNFKTENKNRAFSTIINKLIKNGFIIEKVLEPRPTKKDLENLSRNVGG